MGYETPYGEITGQLPSQGHVTDYQEENGAAGGGDMGLSYTGRRDGGSGF